MPAQVVISWGLPALIGTIVGGAVLLVLLVVLPVVLILRRRHRRALRRVEDGANQELKAVEHTETSYKRRSIPRISIIPAEAANAGYDTLPSNENLRGEYQEKEGKKRRPSDLLSWPLGRRLSKRSQHNAPGQFATQLPSIAEQTRSNQHLDPGRAAVASIGIAGAVVQRSGSPPPQTTPSKALRPLPLFSTRTSATTASDSYTGLKRSSSIPSVLAPSAEITSAHASTRTANRETLIRSFSLNSLAAQKSSEALPPLPSLPNTAGASATARTNPSSKHLSLTSMTSLSSVDTTTSSILKQAASPPIGASASFAHRNPDVGLGLQIHDRDSSDFKHDLLNGATSAGAARTPTHGSWGAEDQNRISVGEVHTAESIHLHSISASPNPSSAIRSIFTPPSRDAHMRKASFCGSPQDREQLRAFRQVSGNSGMPSRDISQASFMTFESTSTLNPFQYSPTPHTNPQPMNSLQLKSALKKGSPGSRKLSNRDGQRARVLSQPTKCWFPEYPSKRSPSVGMDDITENIHEDEIDLADAGYPSPSPDEEVDLDFNDDDEENIPPSPLEEMKRRPTSLKATLNPESVGFEMPTYEDDYAAAQRESQIRHSVASSLLSLSAFPVPSGAYSQSHWQPVPFQRGDIPSEASSPVQQIPDSPTIPGLTLLGQGHEQKPSLPTFPTLPIDPTSLNFNPPAQDAGLGTSPGPMVLATPPRLSSHKKKDSKSEKRASANGWPLQARPLSLNSNLNPVNARPEFSSSRNDKLAPLDRLSGPRAAPPRSLMTTVKGLRRENSNVKHLSAVSKEVRRYASLGRQSSPNLSNNDLWTITDDSPQRDSEAGDLGISVWEDGEQAWPSPRSAPKSNETTPSRTPTSTSKSQKRRAWTGLNLEDQENRHVLMEVPLSHGNVF
jgi:hypothetical protein